MVFVQVLGIILNPKPLSIVPVGVTLGKSNDLDPGPGLLGPAVVFMGRDVALVLLGRGSGASKTFEQNGSAIAPALLLETWRYITSDISC